jgi:hypothetical protein
MRPTENSVAKLVAAGFAGHPRLSFQGGDGLVSKSDHDEAHHFLLFGLWPAGGLPDEKGEGVAPPFLMFLSAFGFFFSLLLRI